MVRQAFAAKLAALGIALAFARDPGCGGVESTSSGVNAPCTRDRDCKDDLTCDRGVCTGHPKDDAGADASQDAPSSDANAADAHAADAHASDAGPSDAGDGG